MKIYMEKMALPGFSWALVSRFSEIPFGTSPLGKPQYRSAIPLAYLNRCVQI
jgi:hypothetical protein